jgi:hypothetical protein
LFVVTQAPLDNQTAPPIRDDVALKEAREALDIALKNIAWKERVIQDCRTIRDEDFQALCKIRDERDELANQVANLKLKLADLCEATLVALREIDDKRETILAMLRGIERTIPLLRESIEAQKESS